MDEFADELGRLDAVAQAELVRSGQVSAAEMVRSAIARIEARDPKVRALVHRRFDHAIAEAESSNLPEGPFRGVPIVLKALGGISAGDPDYQANVLLKRLDHRATEDANFVRILRRAGFVIVGLTSTSEFGLSSTAESVAHGPTFNPWDLTRSTGGSSGGSAAAVSSEMVAVGQGTDGGGSLRMPASHCGVIGFKSSRGRVSQGSQAGDPLEGHNVIGILSRTVRDSAALLDVLSDAVPGDPVVAPRPSSEPYASLCHDPGQLRIGVMLVDQVAGVEVHSEVIGEVRRMAGVLEAMGHRVELSYPSALLDPEYREVFIDLLSPSVTALIDDLAALAGRELARDEAEDVAWYWYERGRMIAASDQVRNQVWRDNFRRRVISWWRGGFDVLLCPVLPDPAQPLGYLQGSAGVQRSLDALAFTPQFNSTGQPAVSLPTGMTSAGLPVGIQLVAEYGREDILFMLSSQIERREAWGNRRPSILDADR